MPKTPVTLKSIVHAAIYPRDQTLATTGEVLLEVPAKQTGLLPPTAVIRVDGAWYPFDLAEFCMPGLTIANRTPECELQLLPDHYFVQKQLCTWAGRPVDWDEKTASYRMREATIRAAA